MLASIDVKFIFDSTCVLANLFIYLIFIGCSGLQIFSKYSAVNSPG